MLVAMLFPKDVVGEEYSDAGRRELIRSAGYYAGVLRGTLHKLHRLHILEQQVSQWTHMHCQGVPPPAKI